MRRDLRNGIKKLFSYDPDIALFYFAGHGHFESTGGYLLATDIASGDEGIPLDEVLVLANKSEAKHKIIVLDSCHSGIAASSALAPATSNLSEGITILTGSTAEQYAEEEFGEGVFTSLFVEALKGAARNLMGEITPGSVYAHIDQSLGPWDQRPVFKTNVKSFVSLRQVQPPIEKPDLRKIVDYFPEIDADSGDYFHALDPGYEPESDVPEPAKTAIFKVLQKYSRVNLVVPVGTEHMYFAAMEGKPCKLTPLGKHYRKLVERGLI